MYITTQQLKDTAIKNLSNDIAHFHNFPGESNKIESSSKVIDFERLSHNKASVRVNVSGIADFQVIVYVNTNVVTTNLFTNQQWINTDSYYTVTTKKVINDYSKIGVYQKNFEWFTDKGKAFEQVEYKLI